MWVIWWLLKRSKYLMSAAWTSPYEQVSNPEYLQGWHHFGLLVLSPIRISRFLILMLVLHFNADARVNVYYTNVSIIRQSAWFAKHTEIQVTWYQFLNMKWPNPDPTRVWRPIQRPASREWTVICIQAVDRDLCAYVADQIWDKCQENQWLLIRLNLSLIS